MLTHTILHPHDVTTSTLTYTFTLRNTICIVTKKRKRLKDKINLNDRLGKDIQ